MAQKFVTINHTTGAKEEVEASITSAGATDAGKIPALDANGLLNQDMMPAGVLPDTAELTVNEAAGLAAGNFVTINSDGTVSKASNASYATRARGFVLSGAIDAAQALVFFDGVNTALSSLTLGTKYFMGTAGAATTTLPSASGEVLQFLGTATSTTAISFNPDDGTVLA